MDQKKAARCSERPSGVTIPDRAQPHDLAVERAVLAAMLREPDCIDTAKLLLHGPESFYSPVHRELFRALLALRESKRGSVDLISLAHFLKTENKLEAIGGEIFLAELDGAISTTVNFESWCDIVKKYAMLRRMIDVCSESLVNCYDTEADPGQLVEKIESDIFEVRSADAARDIAEIKPLIKEQFYALQEMINGNAEVGIPTGFGPVDQCTGGLKKGEMFVLAARPSIGKTALALNVIANLVLPSKTPHPRKVALFSLEMTAGQIARRLLCTEAGVSESVFWNRSFPNSQMNRLTKAVSNYAQAKLFIDETAGLTIADFRAKARRLKRQEDIDVIVIDYLQLMHADVKDDSRQQEVSAISGGIKAVAKDLKIPILVLAQLNREVDKTAGAGGLKPKLAHLRESGSIEQDADIVSFLHRNRDEAKEVTSPTQSVPALWIIEKNRNGRTGEVPLNFFPAKMEFVTASPRSESEEPAAK